MSNMNFLRGDHLKGLPKLVQPLCINELDLGAYAPTLASGLSGPASFYDALGRYQVPALRSGYICPFISTTTFCCGEKMPTVADVPIEIILDNLLPLLPISDLHSLGATNRSFYNLTSDETLWKRKIRQDYNFPDSNTARTTGWKFIYKRLSNPKIYLWG